MKKGVKIVLIILFLALTLVIFAVASFFILTEPNIDIYGFEKLDTKRLVTNQRTITLLDKNNDKIGSKIYHDKKLYVSIKDIPIHTQNAFIAIEDKRFFSHKGIDYKRIISALGKNILSFSFKEGASTITQQLVKNTHLTNEKKISRKLQEIRIAKHIERVYSKEQILEMYLNILYFGNNIYGIETASMQILGKKTSELSVSESALLAAIINNPKKYSPYNDLESAYKRRNIILEHMSTQEMLSPAELVVAKKERQNIKKLDTKLFHYADFVVTEASQKLHCLKSEIYDKGYIIGTNFDSKLQNFVSQSLEFVINKCDKNAVVLASILDNKSGKIIATSSNSPLNISEYYRQPGSIIKPILSYAPLLETNEIHPLSPLEDAPITLDNYSPQNINNKYYGWTDIENALSNSSNVCAVKLLNMIGIDKAKNFASRMGINFDANDNYLSLALGGMTKGVQLNELVTAYSIFANMGDKISASYINFILDKNGKEIYRYTPEKNAVIKESTAYLMNNMLKTCAKKGTARRLADVDFPICSKTGTVGNKNGNSDAYCLAYTPYYTIGVWIGQKNTSKLLSNSISGGGYPTILAKMIMTNLHKNLPPIDFIKPYNLVARKIDKEELQKNHRLTIANDFTAPINIVEDDFPIGFYLPYASRENYDNLHDLDIDEDNFIIF